MPGVPDTERTSGWLLACKRFAEADGAGVRHQPRWYRESPSRPWVEFPPKRREGLFLFWFQKALCEISHEAHDVERLHYVAY